MKQLEEEKEELKGRLQEITLKAKDHLRTLQERLAAVTRDSAEQLRGLQDELAASRAEGRRVHGADAELVEASLEVERKRSKQLEDERASLRERLSSVEASVSNDCGTEPFVQELQRQLAELRGEHHRTKQEHDAKIAEVVRKAKEGVLQLQTRLEASLAENKEMAERHSDVDATFKQQQEKVQKYKQLMAAANSRIEESEAAVRELRDSLSRSQAQRLNLQEIVDSTEKSLSVPPSKEEIARRGGILVAVETDNDDVWCLISTAAANLPAEEEPEAISAESRKARWWLLSQLEVDDRPIPLQRRWKGEVSALRAQMLRFKKRSEELQEEFDSYRDKANAALQSTASHSQEIQIRERRAERLGEQLQAVTRELENAEAEKATLGAELCDVKRRLGDASARKGELERLLERRQREAEEHCRASLEAQRAKSASHQEDCERNWRERDRQQIQELEIRSVQKEALDVEVASLRALLDTRSAEASVAAEEAAAAKAAASAAKAAAAEAISAARAKPVAPLPPPMPEAEVSKTSSRLEPNSEVVAPEVKAKLPTQAYALTASTAWQDLVNLRSQVRQLETHLQDERQQLTAARKDAEAAKLELRELTVQQRLRETMGQHQQMEYIRNVFRKFVESLPQGSSAEHEQLIPVLMTFFKFGPEDARAIQSKRQGGKAQSIWSRFQKTAT